MKRRNSAAHPEEQAHGSGAQLQRRQGDSRVEISNSASDKCSDVRRLKWVALSRPVDPMARRGVSVNGLG